MESACGIQINNCINFTSGTACQHSGAPHRSKWNGCTAYAEQLSRFTVTCILLIGVITATVLVYEAAEEKLPDWVRVCGLGIYSLFGMYVMTMQIVALCLA